MMVFDAEKMKKIPPPDRFFDLNDLWYFSNRWVVRFLYPLPVSANQITFFSLLLGLVSAAFYVSGSEHALILGAVFLYGKIYLDNVDGNLARVRGEVSRVGRFLDSLTDFTVCVAVYCALTWTLVRDTGDASLWFLGFFALLSGLVHCSYFVFYLVKYTSMIGSYRANRVDETVTEADRDAAVQGEKGALILQRLHVWFYGWQDRAIEILDRFSLRLTGNDQRPDKWYGDKLFLSLSSPLCLCTNNMALVIFSLFDCVELGLVLIVWLGNSYMAGLQAWKILRCRRAV